MNNDEIHVAGLVLNVRIGVTERERAQSQRVTVFLTPGRAHDQLFGGVCRHPQDGDRLAAAPTH